MNSQIEIENAHLRFRVYRNQSPNLKESALAWFSKTEPAQTFFEVKALRNINLSINGGDRLGILGLNGAGKSTLLKMLVGIYRPYKGRVTVSGRLTPLIELGTGFDPDLTGRENIYMSGSLLGHSLSKLKSYESEIIDFSELNEFIDMPVKYLSSGMTSRLAFSIGTILDPEILLIDEVFATGDAQFVAKASEKTMSLFSNAQIVVFVSHNLDNLVRLCNRAIVMHRGKIINEGSPEEMVQYYMNHVAGCPASRHHDLAPVGPAILSQARVRTTPAL